MTKSKILLIGGGGHCRACIDVVEQEGHFEIAGIVDNSVEELGDHLFGYAVVGTDDDLPALRNEYEYAFVTIGQIKSTAVRVRMVQRLKQLGFELPTFISPTAYVSKHAWIGEGSVVMHGAVVNAGASVGAHCILNSQSLVEHDAIVGDHVHISTGARINGGSSVGAQSFVGSGAVLIQGIKLSGHTFVRAGSLVKSQSDCTPMSNEQ